MREKTASASLENIGERIRAVRIKRGMTQAQLAGGDITRNMLSRIENGAALPSLPTLCAIADRLGVPAGALLGDLGDYVGWHTARELESLLSAKKYEKIIDKCTGDEAAEIGDEIGDTLCKAYIGNAVRLYKLGKLTEAENDLAKAERLCAEHLSDDDYKEDKLFTLRMLIEACSARRDAPEDSALPLAGNRLSSIIFKDEEAVYLYCLSSLFGITGSAYSTPHERAGELTAELSVLVCRLTTVLYRSHIQAKLDMINAEYLDAKAKLLKLISPEPPLPILYELYRDLEFCCKCCGDFENAYKYSGLRLELLKRIN